ncbi:two-component system sensor histidine kinase BprS [Pseudoduganella ginsengisoli]|uniref:histidine kinase n=1 Tax=Pseudoduganella ginsengisoli TaxID=1462440 RepID=A0A6L6Q0S0_9BURK|nr:ATP-binding protein [Pseudoduganella ginsengisoli]MTW02999.1 two-component sensor histidine kinase [Pseudoduganella ginsengisoli]
MNRLFFRFFLFVMLAITGAAFAVHFAISRLYGDPLEDIARRQAAAQIFLLQHYVDQAPPDEWLARLNKVREVSDVRYDLVPLAQVRAALPESRHAALARGDVVIDVAHKAFFRRVDLKGERYVGSDEDVIHAQGLPIDTSQALWQEGLRYAVVALALLAPIALWSRSHWKGLQHLSQVADDFGAGQLSARAVMPRSASIYPLAERMNAMAARIGQLLESQRSLLHSVSHEIRTPIARLEFGLELLRSAADAESNPALEKRIAAMEKDLYELNALVSELLGMARLDSGQPLQRQPFGLADALRDCVAGLPPGADIELQLADDLGTVDGDARLLMRAVGNLAGNARKYAAHRVVVAAARLPDSVEIIVDDDGPGIPPDEREHIFEPFYRLDRSRDRNTGGFGLGLSIARKAVALHGGSVQAADSPLGGARFTVRLPV